MQSDDDDRSSSSSQSSHSRSSSPEAPTLSVARNDGDDGSDSDSDNSLSEPSKTRSPKPDLESEDDSGSDDDEKRPASSSAASSENEDDRGREQESGGNESSHGSRSRSGSASSGRSRSSEHSDSSDREEVKQSSGAGSLKKLWERDPDFYGIRRSSRVSRVGADSRAKPPKLMPQVQRRPAPKKIVAKKRKLSSDAGDSSDEEVTRNVRKRDSGVCYKEEESDDDEMIMSEIDDNQTQNGEAAEPEEHFETIERVMDLRDGKKGATGSGTTIYTIEKNGDPNLTLPPGTEIEKQFLIKWVGWSHLHNTWESLDTLQELKAKGLKKLDNYCKKEDELARWRRLASPEDVEYFECQLELQQELAKCYINAERIVAENHTEDGQLEYFVKWDCLPYAEATWESGSLMKHRSPEAIEIFRKRESSTRTPSSNARTLRSRPKFVPLKSQPDYMSGDNGNLVLRDYQLDGVNWLAHSWCKENSVILADEMGLGKTIQTICLLSYLFETHNLYGPYLLVVPLSTMAAWQREFAQWAPQINVVTYLGDISSRDIIRDHEWFFKSNGRIKFNAVLTTYEIVLKDKAFFTSLSWAILMVDEAHRLKNGDSLLYKTLEEFETYHRLLITGTPLQNSLKELWSLLHFIMPIKFDDWESFEKEHDHAAAKGYSRLHKQLEPFILRRVKKDVEKSLPAKVEQILRVEMTTLQKQYYKWILTKNYSALRKGIKGSVSSFINVVMELKKCCNHATLVKPIENPINDTVTQLIKGSGKLMLLDKLLVRLRETGHRVLIFSQMVRMLDIIAEYLQLRRFSFQRLDGSIKGDLRKQALDHFNAEGSTDFCFLLSTRAGGLGINLATADTVIIFDSDWNPQNDLQAQARAHRIGQKNQVNIYRLVTKNSVEEDIVERAKKKMVLDHLVIQRMDTTGRTVLDKGSKSGTPFNKDELTAILKFGAEELFKEDDNDGEDQCDIDDILRRAETHEDPGERPGDELLSAFKVASFTVNEEEEEQIPASVPRDWDQIIPEDIRKQVEAEEKEREMAELFLPPRSSRAVLGAPVDNGFGTNTKDALKKVTRKRKKGESDESESEDDGSPKKKKRGRPKSSHHKEKNGIKGFNTAQIRRFIKSIKRFPKPLLRIETIAKDAELTDKAFADLKKLGEAIVKGCKNAMLEAKKNPAMLNSVKEELLVDGEGGAATGAEGKKKPREKGPLFIFNGTSINARTLTLGLDELEPLGEAIPKDPDARRSWKLELKAKVPPYDVEWGQEEDTQLLLGLWEFGTAGWDKIRESSPLLKEKIFLEGDKKPLIKHAQARADYLIKVIKKNLALTQKQNQTGNVRKKRVPKDKAQDDAAADAKVEGGIKDEAKEKKPRIRKPKKPKDSGPMHFTANSKPTSLNVLGGLEPAVFNECKEKMRPVKKALKSLDNPDQSLSEKDQIRHTRLSLLLIGDQIQTLLQGYKNKDEMKKWKCHLWYFVSNFTEYDHNNLYKLYKKASKKAEEKGERTKGGKGKSKEKVEKVKANGLKSAKDKGEHERSPKHRSKEGDKKRKGADRPHERNSHDSGKVEHESASRPFKDNYQDRDRDRERERDRYAYSGGENERISAALPHGDSSSSSYGGSHYNSPQKYRNSSSAYSPTGFSGPSPPRTSNPMAPDSHFSYRERDTRDRVTSDPRERVGSHAGKNYYNNNFDRDRGGPDRGGFSTGRSSWSGQRGTASRWGGSSNYGGPRRDDGPSNYSHGSSGNPSNGPSYGDRTGSRGQPPFRGRGGSNSYSAAGRIAPPLEGDPRQWRRGPPETEVVPSSSNGS